MNLTNARFGEAVGKQVLLNCSQHIASRLSAPNDLLFRWTGPAFVAMMERAEIESITGEVQRIASIPLNRFFETASRTVYLPMKLSGEMISTPGRGWAEVSDQLERFILKASHS